MAAPIVGSAIIGTIKQIGTIALKKLAKKNAIKKSKFHSDEIKKELDLRKKTPLRNMGGRKTAAQEFKKRYGK